MANTNSNVFLKNIKEIYKYLKYLIIKKCKTRNSKIYISLNPKIKKLKPIIRFNIPGYS